MATFDLIPTPTSISADWFNQCFAEQGLAARVASFTQVQIGTGQIGQCWRYEFEFSATDERVPASLVGKFSSADATSRATGVQLQNFLKEVRFYQELQSQLSIRTPRCFFAEIIDEGPDFFLLLEDLAPAEQGNQLLGCSARVARSALSQLVGLHAPSWCDESLRRHSWLLDESRTDRNATFALYRAQLPAFMDYYSEHLASDEMAIIERLGEADSTPLNAEFPDVFALIHVDYRLDNLLIFESEHRCEVAAVDWQSVTLGAPLNDVAYFLGAGLIPGERKAVEKELVRSYYDALLAKGVSHFSWQDCWTAYRRGVYAGFAVTVIASCLVQHTERGDQMFTTMARRHARHALDLGAEEFLLP